MPVRSLNSSVLTWPDRKRVDAALRQWLAQEACRHPTLLRFGYFGSYARGDWGVGSDLDLIAIVSASSEPFDRRTLPWDLNTLPVPAELLVYTREEWTKLTEDKSGFAATVSREAVWIYP